MKTLVRFLLIFTCMKLIVTKPQHLQEQFQQHLNPLNEPQFEYPPKDHEKRTLGFRHYAVGKHIGIHPSGVKYVLGYSPINIKYVPVIKPVTVLKPVLQQSIRPLWKPVMPPSRPYLPPVPIHHVDHEWKPVIKPVHVAPVKPWIEEHVHPVVEQPVPVVKPIVTVQPFLPAPIKPILPIAPAPVVPVKPIHNYFYFQTPVAKPAYLPQAPLFHVARPQLPVLPLGATFPAPVLPAHTAPGLLHFPNPPSLIPAHPPVSLPEPVHPPLPAIPAHSPPIAQPVYPAPHPPVPIPSHPQPVLPPVSIEFHGTRHFVPFNQFPVTAAEVPVPVPKVPEVIVGRQPHTLHFHPEVHTNFIPQVTHLHPVGHPHVPHQVTHLHPVPAHHPPEVQDHGHQPPFNPEAAIQPGQTDLQVPMHLPHHPHFRQIHGFDHIQPSAQFPPFQNPGNIIRPSISLEPPLTHGHS